VKFWKVHLSSSLSILGFSLCITDANDAL